jgi:opacity protein-like surface antigen
MPMRLFYKTKGIFMYKHIALSLCLATSVSAALADTKSTRTTDTTQSSTLQDRTAQAFNPKSLYAGFGLSVNRVDTPFKGSDSKTASGLQGFMGYNFGRVDSITAAAEVGYSQTSDFYSTFNSDVGGLWLAGLIKSPLPNADQRLQLLGKAGYDLGDDSGIFLGLGAEFSFNPVVALRAEYLNKDAITSYQVNVIVNF